MDGSGNIVITWSERVELMDNRLANIYAQRYLSDGSKTGHNFQVNSRVEREFSWYSSKPCVSLDKNGSFIITWMGVRDEDPDIFARQYSSDGSPLDSNFMVNDDVRNFERISPSIAVDNNGTLGLARFTKIMSMHNFLIMLVWSWQTIFGRLVKLKEMV